MEFNSSLTELTAEPELGTGSARAAGSARTNWRMRGKVRSLASFSGEVRQRPELSLRFEVARLLPSLVARHTASERWPLLPSPQTKSLGSELLWARARVRQPPARQLLKTGPRPQPVSGTWSAHRLGKEGMSKQAS